MTRIPLGPGTDIVGTTTSRGPTITSLHFPHGPEMVIANALRDAGATAFTIKADAAGVVRITADAYPETLAEQLSTVLGRDVFIERLP